MEVKGANQLYKQSGSTLKFTDWLNREKAKGVVIPQKEVNDNINKDLKEKLENPVKENKNKVIGLDKRILILSAVVILGAVAYNMYRNRK